MRAERQFDATAEHRAAQHARVLARHELHERRVGAVRQRRRLLPSAADRLTDQARHRKLHWHTQSDYYTFMNE